MLEEIKRRVSEYKDLDKWRSDIDLGNANFETMKNVTIEFQNTGLQDREFLLQVIDKLQQENERYKEALEKIKRDIPIESDNPTVLMGKAAIAIGSMRRIAEEALKAESE